MLPNLLTSGASLFATTRRNQNSWNNRHNTNRVTTVSTKQSCIDDYNNRHLDMTDEKCNECECRYSCYFQMMAYNDVVEGN